MSYITVTRKHSSRQLCTQLGRATLDLMFNSQITTTRPIRVIFCYKVGPPTSVLNWYVFFLENFGTTSIYLSLQPWIDGRAATPDHGLPLCRVAENAADVSE